MTAHPTAAAALVIESHLGAAELQRALRDDVRAGLTATPKSLPPKWFYDSEGSRLFDAITRLPEYYPTRAEKALLVAHAGEVAALSQADTLVELGSGTSEKTRLLLDALATAGTLRRFVPFDVDATVLADAGEAILREHPGIAVHAVVGDFERHLPLLPTGGRRIVAFLGSTIGNFEPTARERFLHALAGTLATGDTFLLGVDLVKEPARLVAAYDDAQGVTAAFNKNVLRVVDHALDADLDPADFDHVAVWDAEQAWIEMRLRARREVIAHVRALGLEVRFAAGEELRTEVSAKTTQARAEAELRAAGLLPLRWWTDGDVALSLSTQGAAA